MKNVEHYLFFGMMMLVVVFHPLDGIAQSGNGFVITQYVIANGGGRSTDAGNVFSITGTIGQPKAGDNSTGTPFNVKTGFWTPFFAPTAANASISGRVTVENGRGLKDVRVVLSGGALTAPRMTITNMFGYFQFEDLAVGQTYVVSVRHKLYDFSQPSQIFTLMDDLTGLDFQASWTKR